MFDRFDRKLCRVLQERLMDALYINQCQHYIEFSAGEHLVDKTLDCLERLAGTFEPDICQAAKREERNCK